MRGEDLNLRPAGYEPAELPDCSTPRKGCTEHRTGCQGGIGFAAWSNRHQRRDVTEIGRALTKARCDLVARHTKKAPVDIQIIYIATDIGSS